MYYLQRNCLLDKYQCGFRTSHPTSDHLVCFETTVREAFFWQHRLSVFFVLEKSYDTAWRYGTLCDLYNPGKINQSSHFSCHDGPCYPSYQRGVVEWDSCTNAWACYTVQLPVSVTAHQVTYSYLANRNLWVLVVLTLLLILVNFFASLTIPESSLMVWQYHSAQPPHDNYIFHYL